MEAEEHTFLVPQVLVEDLLEEMAAHTTALQQRVGHKLRVELRVDILHPILVVQDQTGHWGKEESVMAMTAAAAAAATMAVAAVLTMVVEQVDPLISEVLLVEPLPRADVQVPGW